MRLPLRKHYPAWTPAAAVAAVVVLAGARLITLSVQDHAADLRKTAQGNVAEYAHGFDLQLQTLLERAQAEARRAVPSRNAFWMVGTDVVPRSGDSDPAVSRALASEWVAAQASGRAAG